MYQLNNNVVYVQGALKGAIYDFSSGNVYWISNESCKLLNNVILSKDYIQTMNVEEEQYISLLESKNLFNNEYKIDKYTPDIDNTRKIEIAWLELTQMCNCKCVHCYQGESHYISKNPLSLSDWEMVIHELKQLAISRVVVIGGEPCLHKNIYEILSLLYNCGIQTTLFTNATSISERLMQLIISCKDKISVKVSLYSDNADIHDMITQCPGSFNSLVKNIKKLTSNKVRVNIAVVAMKENQDYIYNIKNFIASLGANYAKFDVIRNVFGGMQDNHTPTNFEVIKSCLMYKPNFKTNKYHFDNNCYKNSCWYGKLAVTETGCILPCVFERNIVYGNIKKNSLREILQSDTLSKYWYMDFSYIIPCKDCEFRYACKDCRPLGFSVNGSLTTKNPRCKYNPYTGEWK